MNFYSSMGSKSPVGQYQQQQHIFPNTKTFYINGIEILLFIFPKNRLDCCILLSLRLQRICIYCAAFIKFIHGCIYET